MVAGHSGQFTPGGYLSTGSWKSSRILVSAVSTQYRHASDVTDSRTADSERLACIRIAETS